MSTVVADVETFRAKSVRRLLLVYLYVLVFGPGVYLSSTGTAKLFPDWIILLFAVFVSYPYWKEMRWARPFLFLYGGYVACLMVASLLNRGSTLYASPVTAAAWAFGAGRPFLVFLSFGSLVRGAMRPRDRAEAATTLWRHLLVLTALLGLLALIQRFGPHWVHQFFQTYWPRRDERLLPDYDESVVWPSVTFDGYYHIFGVFMAMAGSLCLLAMGAREDRRQASVAALGFITAAATVVVSESRSALAALIVGFASVLVLGERRHRRRMLLLGAAPVALGLVALISGGIWDPSYAATKYQTVFSWEVLLGSGEGTGSEVGRLLFWQVHIDHFLAHPIVGSGGYEAVSDSTYLVLLGQGGLVGTALFLAALGALGLRLRGLSRLGDPEVRTYGVAGLAMLVAGLVGAYGINVLQGERLGQVFYFTMAVWLGAHCPDAAELPGGRPRETSLPVGGET
jgi:hypothetical protein